MNGNPLIEKTNWRQVIVLFILAAIGISLQTYFANGGQYTRYNNFVIFEKSFGHLLHHQDMYVYYPSEDFDLFKYSPSFAFFMGIFHILPHFPGLILFNLLNVGVYLVALKRLNFPDPPFRFMLLYLLLEAGISIISAQTNLLTGGLIILAFTCLERKQVAAATLCIVLSISIKIFGVVAFAFWFLYPQKGKFILYSIFWMAVVFALPLLVVNASSLMTQYKSWWVLLKTDQDVSYGASVMGILKSWFSLTVSKGLVTAVGALLFMLPFIKTKLYKLYAFRLQILSSVLIWIVIFNHKAESPTYTIALAGVAIWYYGQQKVKINRVLLLCCLVFVSFTSTDLITPGRIYNRIIEPYAIKAVFCIIIWCKLLWDILTNRFLPRPDDYFLAQTSK